MVESRGKPTEAIRGGRYWTSLFVFFISFLALLHSDET